MKNKFDYKTFIIIILLIVIVVIVGILLKFTVFEEDSADDSSSRSSSKSRRSDDEEEEDEDEDEDEDNDDNDDMDEEEQEIADLVDDWISAQKKKDSNKLMKLVDPIASEALAKSISSKGSTYVIKDFEDNYYETKKYYDDYADENDYISTDALLKEQYDQLFESVTYKKFDITKIKNLREVKDVDNLYEIDFEATVSYKLSNSTSNELTIELKGPLFLIKNKGKFYIVGSYDDISSLSTLY